jgi:phosphoribosylformylglycinamidine cyclo-ligase
LDLDNQKNNFTYKSSGVDTKKASDSVDLIKSAIFGTFSKNVLNDLTSFAGLFELDLKEYKRPVLVSSTDGVGTKVLIAKKMNDYSGIGQDLVAMCANDILCCGARPLFFLDYIACGKLDPSKIKELVGSISKACRKIDCSLIGGETAEMPGVYKEDDIDLAGFIVGMVDKEKIITKDMLKKGDVLLGLKSSGVHSNGYSLIRKVIRDKKLDLNKDYGIGNENKSLGHLLLTPTVLYGGVVDSLLKKVKIHGICHITGGGFYENIPRILPDHLDVKIDSSSFMVDPVFLFLQKIAGIDDDEMFNVFNMGIGMVLAVNRDDLDAAEKILNEKAMGFFEIGTVKEGSGKVRIL